MKLLPHETIFYITRSFQWRCYWLHVDLFISCCPDIKSAWQLFFPTLCVHISFSLPALSFIFTWQFLIFLSYDLQHPQPDRHTRLFERTNELCIDSEKEKEGRRHGRGGVIAAVRKKNQLRSLGFFTTSFVDSGQPVWFCFLFVLLFWFFCWGRSGVVCVRLYINYYLGVA